MEPANNRKIAIPWPQDTRDGALAMYLKQATPSLSIIADELGVPENTLTYWRKTDGWVAKRKSLLSSAQEVILGELLTEEIVKRRQILSDYESMRDTAKTAVEDNTLEFKDKKQAIDSLNLAIRGMADIMDKSISLVFLQEIAVIIIDEVEDKDTRDRLGKRLVVLGRAWSTGGAS